MWRFICHETNVIQPLFIDYDRNLMSRDILLPSRKDNIGYLTSRDVVWIHNHQCVSYEIYVSLWHWIGSGISLQPMLQGICRFGYNKTTRLPRLRLPRKQHQAWCRFSSHCLPSNNRQQRNLHLHSHYRNMRHLLLSHCAKHPKYCCDLTEDILDLSSNLLFSLAGR